MIDSENKLIKWYVSVGAFFASKKMGVSFHCSDPEIHGFSIETDPDCKANIPYACAELTINDLNKLSQSASRAASRAASLAQYAANNYYEARIKHLEKLLADNNIAEPNVLEKEDE